MQLSGELAHWQHKEVGPVFCPHARAALLGCWWRDIDDEKSGRPALKGVICPRVRNVHRWQKHSFCFTKEKLATCWRGIIVRFCFEF